MEKFWNKVVKTSSCWVWTGAKSAGYGLAYSSQFKKYMKVHRIAYLDKYGSIPDGLEIDHVCGVSLCVNPDHLEPVTRSENNLRAWARNNGLKLEDYRDEDAPYLNRCKLGHKKRVTKSGNRYCPECNKNYQKSTPPELKKPSKEWVEAKLAEIKAQREVDS